MHHPGEDLEVLPSAHRAHFCFVFAWKRAAIASLYCVKILVWCVYCAVRAWSWRPFHDKHHLSWLRQLVAGPLPRRPVIDPGSVHVKFMVDRVELGPILGFHFSLSVHECCILILTFWRRNYFFLILAHSVYKMWIIQEPNKLELWNKLHFKEKKTESIHHV